MMPTTIAMACGSPMTRSSVGRAAGVAKPDSLSRCWVGAALEERSWQPFRFNSLLAAFLAGMDTRSGRFASFGRGSASGIGCECVAPIEFVASIQFAASIQFVTSIKCAGIHSEP
jgi:hypothetical protein